MEQYPIRTGTPSIGAVSEAQSYALHEATRLTEMVFNAGNTEIAGSHLRETWIEMWKFFYGEILNQIQDR
jgi:hypothetical protein